MAGRGVLGLMLRGRSFRHLYLFIALVIIAYMGFNRSVWPLSRMSKSKSQDHRLLWSAEAQEEFVESSSLLNRSRANGCVIPKLKLNDSDIMSFFKRYPPASCGKSFDWVAFSHGKFIITPEAIDKYGNVKCNLTSLDRAGDFKTVLGSVLKDVKNGTDLTHDFYLVECVAPDGSKYRNFHAGVHRKADVLGRTNQPMNSKKISLDLDVIMIGQDSLSHMAWIRHLPLTRSYLVNVLNATEMWGHTVVGDGTPATMFPMLTGMREEDLPEARRGYKGAKTVDGFPWVWNEFKKAGYVTAWQEDQSYIGTFHYRLMGFKDGPVDHYFRPFDLYSESKKSDKNCYWSKPNHVVRYNYMKDVLDTYPGKRKWTFTFQSENSHSSNNDASKLDQGIHDHLKSLHDDGHLDNALLIVLGDHGARFSNIRAFAQGKQEERMPYFAIRLPEKFKIKHPDIMRNIKHNSARLTSPFDVHETFKEIIDYTGSGKADISKRGVSLFKEIPIERDCKSADVDPHWCFCLDWSPLPVMDETIRLAVNAVIAMLNSFTQEHRDKCIQLDLKAIKTASQFKVKDDVLKFKDTNDGGRGRFGKMNDGTKHSKIVYQITFITTPGDGLFEATVSRDLITKQFETTMKSVSRINKYGRTPWCIMKTIPQLRAFCVCKQAPPDVTS